MAYFKNKKTGITWHITDNDHIKRLKGRDDYLEVSSINGQDTNKKANHEPVREPVKVDNVKNDKKVDYTSIKWNELRKLASDKGINVKGKKRKQIEQELSKLGGQND